MQAINVLYSLVWSVAKYALISAYSDLLSGSVSATVDMHSMNTQYVNMRSSGACMRCVDFKPSCQWFFYFNLQGCHIKLMLCPTVVEICSYSIYIISISANYCT